MNKAVAVAVGNAGEEDAHENRSLLLIEITLLNNTIKKLATFNELGHDINSLFVLHELENLDNVWMVKAF